MQPSRDRRALGGVLVVPLATAAVLCALGWRATEAKYGPSGIRAMILAQAVLLSVVYATILPKLRRMVGASGLDRMKLSFKAAGQRFVLTLVAAGLIAWKWRSELADVFLVWTGIGYVVLTLAETVALVRWMKRTETDACS